MSRDKRSSRSSTRGLSPQAKAVAYFRKYPKALWAVYAVVVLLAFGVLMLLID